MEVFSTLVNNFLEAANLTKDIKAKINMLSAEGKSIDDFGSELKKCRIMQKTLNKIIFLIKQRLAS